MTEGKAPVHLEALEAIHDWGSTPLGVHGGTSIPLERIGEYVRRGVAKINFGTGLKQACLEAGQDELAAYRRPMSPHSFLGIGSEDYYKSRHEVILNPGEQYTLYPDTPHWFQAGPKGAIVSEFSTRSTDDQDQFSDPRIKRAPEVES